MVSRGNSNFDLGSALKKCMFPAALTFLGAATVVGCGDATPEDYLRADLLNLGFIPYESPLAQAGTGTLVGGSPYQMTLVAPPQTCFPDKNPANNDLLRVVDETDLPSKATSFRVTGNARLGLVDALSKGNAPLSVGVQFEKAQAIEFSYTRPKREYFDSVKLTSYYRDSMPSVCKDYLDKVGFITEAVKVDEMHFKFFSSNGTALDLSLVDPKSLLEVSLGTNWQVINKTELVVSTPKYIGYRMGRLMRSDNGVSLCRSSKVTKEGKYDFQCMDMFQGSVDMSFSPSKTSQPSRTNKAMRFYKTLDKAPAIE